MTELTSWEHEVLARTRGNGPQVFAQPFYHAVEHLAELGLVEVRRERDGTLVVHALPHATCQACGWEGPEDAVRLGRPCPDCGQDEILYFHPAG